MSPDPLPEAKFKLEAKAGILAAYQFGPKTAKHYFCRNCGIYTFHEPASRPGHFRANLGCVEGVDPLSLDVDLFDGKQLP